MVTVKAIKLELNQPLVVGQEEEDLERFKAQITPLLSMAFPGGVVVTFETQESYV